MTLGKLLSDLDCNKVIRYKHFIIVYGEDAGEYYFKVYRMDNVSDAESVDDVEIEFLFQDEFYDTEGEAIFEAVKSIRENQYD